MNPWLAILVFVSVIFTLVSAWEWVSNLIQTHPTLIGWLIGIGAVSWYLRLRWQVWKDNSPATHEMHDKKKDRLDE